MTISESVKKIFKKIVRITLTIILVLLGIILLILILIQTGPVQNYGRGKIEAYLENKLNTRVRIGNLYIGFPSRIILKNIYLEDRKKDTLISGGKIEVEISMLRLFSKEVKVSRLELDDVTLKVKRQMPDSVFNFQFIADAFSSGTKKPATKSDTTGGFSFIIGTVRLHHIRAVYSDDATGNDLWVNLGDFETTVKTFDPAKQHYAIEDIRFAGISGNIRQYKPILLLQHVSDTISAHNNMAEPVTLELGAVDFQNIYLNYRNDTQNIDGGIRLGHFRVRADSLDLARMHFHVKEIVLNNTQANYRFGKLKPEKKSKPPVVQDTVSHGGSWSLDITQLAIDSTGFQYDDDNKRAVRSGMDFSHLKVSQLRLHSSELHADSSNYKALITGFSLKEQSGFVLNNLTTAFDYGNQGASLKNLVIRTPYSEIKSQTSIQYRSLKDLNKHPGNMSTNLEFNRSRVAVRDILVFVPSLESPLRDLKGATLKLNGKVSGMLNNLRIPHLEIEGLGHSNLTASGQIKGLPDAKNAHYDITLTKLNTTRTDLFRFIPEKSFPESLRLPENISANGKFTGMVNHFFVQLHAVTSKGNAYVHGSLDLHQKTYDLIANTNSLDLGYILKQDSLLGTFTGEATASGSGFDPKKMNSNFHVKMEKAVLKSYNYQGLLLDATLKNGTGVFSSSMQDPNITYQLYAETRFDEKYPSLKMNLQLDTLNALALHLMNDSVQMHFRLNTDFNSTDPDKLQGHLALTDIGATLGTQIIHTDSVSLYAHHSDTGQTIFLRSEAADIDWTGKYKLTQVTQTLKQFINHYYKIQVSTKDSTEPALWQMDIRVRPSPLVLILMPSLKGSDSLTGRIAFNSAKRDLALNLNAEKIQFNQQLIHHMQVNANTKGNELDYSISVADAGHQGFRLYQSSLSGKLANDKLHTILRLEDKKKKDRYVLAGVLSHEDKGIRFVLNPDSVLLNYQRWLLPADNFIQYDSSGLLVRNLKLSSKTEALSINSAGETTKSPLEIHFTNFRIKTISQFAEQDSLLLDGIVNGKTEIRNLFTKPLFTADLKIDSLAYEKDSLGTLVIQVDNKELNTYSAHITLKGEENDVQVDGKYFPGESKMDMNVKLNQLNLTSFRSMVSSQVRSMKGYLKGELHASGNLDQPELRGELHFENATVVPVISGEPLQLSNDKISFDEDGFNFDNFVLLDSAGNKAELDGNVFTKDFKNYRFDMSLSAQNFRVVNAPNEPDRLFYGKLNLNADIDVTGDLELPKVNAFLRVNKNTDFILILPSDDPEVVDREGVVVFTSTVKRADSTQFKHFLDSLATHARLKGMDLSGTIETDSSAQFTLIIDERNGDALTMRGRAELTGGVDKSGKLSLTGNYELVNGSYNVTLSILHRKFDIQRGSVVTWTGDPRNANIDITAIYTVNTPPIDLVQQQISTQNTEEVNKYKQRLPFQVKMHMTGELLKPIIKFDIALPDNLLSLWPEVDTKLQQMRTNEAEVNKQVFALLLLGRFVQENPFQSAAAGTDAQSIARQSASKILSDQLNQLAGSLINGVDINFDMNSGKDYSTGTTTNQTELNVKVSKSLFSDRIRVTVGSDFQLEDVNQGQNTTNIAGDISVDYKLSKDGRYMIRVYRKDQYQSVIQAQVVETGLSFILTFDYNKFRELFQNKKETPVAPINKHKKSITEKNPPAK